jgi:hypothetical protein
MNLVKRTGIILCTLAALVGNPTSVKSENRINQLAIDNVIGIAGKITGAQQSLGATPYTPSLRDVTIRINYCPYREVSLGENSRYELHTIPVVRWDYSKEGANPGVSVMTDENQKVIKISQFGKPSREDTYWRSPEGEWFHDDCDKGTGIVTTRPVTEEEIKPYQSLVDKKTQRQRISWNDYHK